LCPATASSTSHATSTSGTNSFSSTPWWNRLTVADELDAAGYAPADIDRVLLTQTSTTSAD